MARMVCLLVVSAVIAGATGPLCDCRAQTLDAVAGTDQEYIKANTDMRSYEIICKTRHEEYLSYYNVIRERILKKLKRNYTHGYNDGDVHLYFVLDRKGALTRMDVALTRSTKDAALIDIALTSLQQASPFGPPPAGLDAVRIPFGLVITFKKDR